MSHPKFISIVVPVHNQGDVLADFLGRLVAYCRENFSAFEIIVVGDASAAVSSQADSVIRLFRLPKHKGRGYAAKFGLWRSTGDVAVVLRPDQAHLDQIFSDIRDRQDSHDVIVGHHYSMFRQAVVRSLFSRVYSHDRGWEDEVVLLAKKMGLRVKDMGGRGFNIFQAIQIRQWHCTPLNLQDQFMTAQET